MKKKFTLFKSVQSNINKFIDTQSGIVFNFELKFLK